MFSSGSVASSSEAVELDARELESEKRETFKSHVLLEARKARLTAELQVRACMRAVLDKRVKFFTSERPNNSKP